MKNNTIFLLTQQEKWERKQLPWYQNLKKWVNLFHEDGRYFVSCRLGLAIV